jgi:hypothetical protein
LHIYRVLHEWWRSGQGLQNSQDAQVDNFFQKVCKGLLGCGFFAQILLSQNARRVPQDNWYQCFFGQCLDVAKMVIIHRKI